jgi:hypothetical protein
VLACGFGEESGEYGGSAARKRVIYILQVSSADAFSSECVLVKYVLPHVLPDARELCGLARSCAD